MGNDINDTPNTNEDRVQPVETSTETVSPDTISFYERYRLAMIAWVKEKKNTNFPIGEVPNGKGGVKLKWFNREDRKLIPKQQKQTR